MLVRMRGCSNYLAFNHVDIAGGAHTGLTTIEQQATRPEERPSPSVAFAATRLESAAGTAWGCCLDFRLSTLGVWRRWPKRAMVSRDLYTPRPPYVLLALVCIGISPLHEGC